jgi:hypothetical protein
MGGNFDKPAQTRTTSNHRRSNHNLPLSVARIAENVIDFPMMVRRGQFVACKLKLNVLTSLAVATALAATSVVAHQGEKGEAASGEEVTVTGEVVDMACYIDDGASGAEHADCARTCIKLGLPAGIKTSDGKTYLLIGEHKPMNDQLAPLAAKIITVKGTAVSRDGFNMIENAEIVKK